MRRYQVILRSGANVDIVAKVMLDDLANPNRIYFFSDEAQRVIVATFKRKEVAGIIFHLPKPSSIPLLR